MTQEQADKVAELIKAGWKVTITEPPVLGGVIKVESPEGKSYLLVDGSGSVRPELVTKPNVSGGIANAGNA